MAEIQWYVGPRTKNANQSMFYALEKRDEALVDADTNVGLRPFLIPASERELRDIFRSNGEAMNPELVHVFKKVGNKIVFVSPRVAKTHFSKLRLT